MEYKEVREAVFLRRPNRFVAYCMLAGKEVACHVKNTGRCRELLLPGARVWLEKAENPNRKTAWSLISVYKGNRLINIDSQAPNQVIWEAFSAGFRPDFLPGPVQEARREAVWGDSRFDLRLTVSGRPFYLEMKGVTLEEAGVVRFPDAPTVRGRKHLRELARMRRQGLAAGVIFVVQMDRVSYFTPNVQTDPDFAAALWEARQAGVEICAWDCRVSPVEITLKDPIPVRF